MKNHPNEEKIKLESDHAESKDICDLCREHGSCFLLPENREVYQLWRDAFRMTDEEIMNVIPSEDEHRISPLGLVQVKKGHAALRARDYEAAYLYYMEATQQSSYKYPIWTYVGISHYFLGNIEEAVDYSGKGFNPFVGYENNKGNRFNLYCENLLEQETKLPIAENKEKEEFISLR